MSSSEYFDAEGELTEAGLQAYAKAMRTRQLETLPDEMHLYVQNRPDLLHQAFLHIDTQTLQTGPKRRNFLHWRIAAVAAVLVLIGTGVWFMGRRFEETRHENQPQVLHTDSIQKAIPDPPPPPLYADTPQPSPNVQQSRQGVPDEKQATQIARIMKASPSAFLFDEVNPGGLMGSEGAPEVHLTPVSDSVQINELRYVWRTDASEVQFRLLDRNRQLLGAMSRLRSVKPENGLVVFELSKDEVSRLTSGGYYVATFAEGNPAGTYKIWFYRLK